MNLSLVQQTLRGEGCPEAVIGDVVEYCRTHPDVSLAEMSRHLDKIATRFGHPNYREYKRAGFQLVPQDSLLVSVIYAPA